MLDAQGTFPFCFMQIATENDVIAYSTVSMNLLASEYESGCVKSKLAAMLEIYPLSVCHIPLYCVAGCFEKVASS